jgi:pimeloyl-ACP methyl ester carboxylesterase
MNNVDKTTTYNRAQRPRPGHKCRQLGLPLGLLAFLLGVPLSVAAQNNPAGAVQACIIYEVQGLGCALSGQGPGCWDLALARYNACVARAQTLPPAPLPPAVTPTPRPLDRCPPQSYGEGGIIATNFCVELIDPVPDLVNNAGTGLIANRESLATRGTVVQGVAADGAARVVLRISANFEGEHLKLLLRPDGAGNPNNLPQPDGVLATTEGVPSGYELRLTAVNTSEGPRAFALYFPPKDFSRGGDDDNARNRNVVLQVASVETPSSSSTVGITIARPPVVLVHGLWENRADWNRFTPLVGDPRGRFALAKANYDIKLSASNSQPEYTPDILRSVSSNAFGFSPNAPLVLADINRAINDSKTNGIATAQVDVVAHSMGGTITRALEYLPDYTNSNSFKIGSVHKLITIGTPHLGSPLARQLLQQGPIYDNSCVRDVFAQHGHLAFSSVTPAGTASPLAGGLGDLAVDADGNLSEALQALKESNPHEAPTALIAATENDQNLAGLKSFWHGKAQIYLRDIACTTDQLARALTAEQWSSVFDGQESDGIVPRKSQFASRDGALFPGLIHSSGLEDLGFNGPSELDPDSQSHIPSKVIQLLNAPTGSGYFQLLTH